MAVTPLRPLTATGVDESVVVPFPSSPYVLSPQQSTVPPVRRAQAWTSPPAMAVVLVRPLTGTGVPESVVVPFPSWPFALAPQQSTVPPVRRPQVDIPCAARA